MFHENKIEMDQTERFEMITAAECAELRILLIDAKPLVVVSSNTLSRLLDAHDKNSAHSLAAKGNNAPTHAYVHAQTDECALNL